MEHKLIQGAEHYLAFARSCIKKLKGLGLAYVSQKFDMGDAIVKVSIKPGHEYIEINGGSNILKMDSGLANIMTVTDTGGYPTDYSTIPLLEVGSAVAYNVPFVAPVGSNWRLKPGGKTTATNLGQVSGDISFPMSMVIRGRVPHDNVTAASFAPKSVAVSGATPPSWIYATDDEAVWAKKLMVTKCPASMFTGKTRLYVQSMYGAHLYERTTDGLGNLLSASVPIPCAASLGNSVGQPWLNLAPYIDSADKAAGVGYPAVALTTSAGVYLDPTTGKHWLFRVGTETLEVMPLIGSPSAEKARSGLRGTKLNATDREHLEAYILATCAPYVKMMKSCTFVSTPGYSMGYGWHWNWSGTCADIAINTTEPIGFEAGFDRFGMVSSHYRLTPALSMDADGNVTSIACTRAVIRNAEHWACLAISWAVCEPDWGTMSIDPTVPWYGAYRAGAGTFYVFYDRDTLRECRIDIVRKTGAAERISTPPTFADNTTPFSVMQKYTAGLLPGECRDIYDTTEYYFATITCSGATETKGVSVLFAGREVKVSNVNKVQPSLPVPIDSGPSLPYDGELVLDMGYPLDMTSTSSASWRQLHTGGTFSYSPGAYDPQAYSPTTIEFDEIIEDKFIHRSSSLTAIIPFFDAESIFLHWGESETYDSSAKVTRHFASNAYATTYGYKVKNGVWSGYWTGPADNLVWVPVFTWDGTWHAGDKETRYQWATSTGSTMLTEVYDYSTPPAMSYSTIKHVSRAGVIDATIDTLSYYHGPDPAPAISSWTSAGVPAVAYSPGHITPVGTTNSSDKASLVGWV